MPALCTAISLSECVFSFYLTGTSTSSYIDFGTPDSSIAKVDNDKTWISIAENNYWSSTIKGFRWGPEWSKSTPVIDATEYKITEQTAIVDTGSSCIVGPKESINSILATILNTADSVVTDSTWGYIFDCADKKLMPSFELLFGGSWFRVNPEDYVNVVDDNGKLCSVCIGTDKT